MSRGYLCGLVLAAGSMLAAGVQAREKVELSAEDGKTAQMVASMVSSRHINHPPIDDALSEKLFQRYLEVWDPQKLYFLQSDIDQFAAEKDKLDDGILKGDVGFAAVVFERFRERMTARAEKIPAVVDAEHDFTVDEEIPRDADELPWAASEAELDERWRKRIKFDLLMLKLEDKKDDDPRKRLKTRYRTNQVYIDQTEPHEVLELYLSSMTHCLDPHSSYMSPQTLDDFETTMKLKLEGIGARLKYEDGYTTVEEVIQGGAAAADGRLTKGDRVIGVSADAVSDYVDVVEMKLNKVVDMIRGKKGTKVRLKIRKEAGGIEEIELTRTEVKITEDEVKGKVIEASDWTPGRKARIGVLELGNLDAKRDWGHARDYVEAMWLMLQQDAPRDYVISMNETHSVREFIEIAAGHLNMKIVWTGEGIDEVGTDLYTGRIVVRINPAFYRPAEVDLLLGDSSLARNELGWRPQNTFADLVKDMVDSDLRLAEFERDSLA